MYQGFYEISCMKKGEPVVEQKMSDLPTPTMREGQQDVTEGIESSEPTTDLKGSLRLKSAARLMAVQALYQMEQTGLLSQDVIAQFHEEPLSSLLRDQGIVGDVPYFQELVTGVSSQYKEIDARIKPFLVSSWQMERLPILLRTILRVGAYELSTMLDIPASILINDHVTLAHGFFENKEPSFVNAVLDKISREIRGGSTQ